MGYYEGECWMIADDFRDMIECLNAQGVDYLIVGAFAMAHFGYRRATGDIDIFVRPTSENAQQTFDALIAFGAPLSAHNLSADYFATEGNFYQIGLPPNRIDILTHIDGVSFEEAHDHIVRGRVGGLEVSLLSLELLIKNKEATGRPKDQVDADELKRLRVQGG